MLLRGYQSRRKLWTGDKLLARVLQQQQQQRQQQLQLQLQLQLWIRFGDDKLEKQQQEQ
jgi:hypothetical protein